MIIASLDYGQKCVLRKVELLMAKLSAPSFMPFFFKLFLCSAHTRTERSQHPQLAELIDWSVAERSGLRYKPVCVHGDQSTLLADL